MITIKIAHITKQRNAGAIIKKCWGNNKEKTLSFKMNRRIKPNKLSNKRDRKKKEIEQFK